MSNAINWFDLPATDFDRAAGFYKEVLGAELQRVEADGYTMGFFPSKDNGVGGCIVHGQDKKPSADGTLVYLNGGDDLADPLGRVENAGGKVVMPKTSIGEFGYMAVFMDTEGNKVAFHSIG